METDELIKISKRLRENLHITDDDMSKIIDKTIRDVRRNGFGMKCDKTNCGSNQNGECIKEKKDYIEQPDTDQCFWTVE